MMFVHSAMSGKEGRHLLGMHIPLRFGTPPFRGNLRGTLLGVSHLAITSSHISLWTSVSCIRLSELLLVTLVDFPWLSTIMQHNALYTEDNNAI